MSTVPTPTDNVQPTDQAIAASLARIDQAIAAVEASLAEHSSDLKTMKTARVRRDVNDAISVIIAAACLLAVIALVAYGTVVALGGAR